MYRNTGIGLSIVLIAAGAILAWAVDVHTDGINLNTVGIILFVVGIVGLILSFLLGAIGTRHDVTVVDEPMGTVQRERWTH